MKEQFLPIGLFDSGVGGITVLNAIRTRMPGEDYLYLGDTARLPYGTKSLSTVCQYAIKAAATLVERKIKMLVIACNTATAAALPELCKTFPSIPIIGVIEPSAQEACKLSRQGSIAVLATKSTIQGDVYKKTILQYAPNAYVQNIACPLFVPIVEEGLFHGPIVDIVIQHYLAPIFCDPSKKQPDCIVLGCTHYPFLTSAIQKFIGEHVHIVDSAKTTACYTEKHITLHNLMHPKGNQRTGTVHFLTTDGISQFLTVGNLLLKDPIEEHHIEHIDIHSIPR